MNFCYINDFKCRNKNEKMIFFSNLKKCTRPANEFLLHDCRNNKYIFFFKSEKNTSPANEFLLHKCRNKTNKKNDFFFQI